MITILIINSKGGAGKTTICTNLASYYASKKFRTTIMDYDPQGSCLQWLKMRPDHMRNIHGANAAPSKGANTLHNLQKWVPAGTEILIIDAPSGARGLLLQEMVRRSNFILVPVVPSPIDIHATNDFIRELFTFGGASHTRNKVAVVANRVRNSSPIREPLERFFTTLKLQVLTNISDSDNYLRAVEQGVGVFEMDEAETFRERQELSPILKWVDAHAFNRRITDTEDNVVSLDESRRVAANDALAMPRLSLMRRKMDRQVG